MKVYEYQRSRSFLYHILPGFVCFVLYLAKISGERLEDHWSSGIVYRMSNLEQVSSYLGYMISTDIYLIWYIIFYLEHHWGGERMH